VDWGTEGEKNVRGREEKVPSRSSLGNSGFFAVAGDLLIMFGFR
jgi:hypothetical protein